jgi:hypothetical protein
MRKELNSVLLEMVSDSRKFCRELQSAPCMVHRAESDRIGRRPA